MACYARVLALTFDSEARFECNAPTALDNAVFPPGVLLPMASHLLARGAGAGTAWLQLNARARDSWLSLRVAGSRPLDEATLSELRQVLADLYDERAWLQPQLVGEPPLYVIELEVPFEDDRDPSAA